MSIRAFSLPYHAVLIFLCPVCRCEIYTFCAVLTMKGLAFPVLYTVLIKSYL